MIDTLKGKKGLVIGIANKDSIAWGCAKAFREAGAELAITYQKSKTKVYAQPLADELEAPIFMQCDVQADDDLDALFQKITDEWGELDFILHSIAFAPKQDLGGRVTGCSREGFAKAMDISCHSFIRMARKSEPLMKKGGCLLTVSYFGAEKVVDNYNIMGPVKAALESSVRYLAAELGTSGIRVNSLSPGPIATRAASGIGHFDELMKLAKEKSPEHELVSIKAVGAYARFLVSDEANMVTGSNVYIDAGYNIMGA